MRALTEMIAIGACASSLAVMLASPADAVGRGTHVPGGQVGYHHLRSGCLHGAPVGQRGVRHRVVHRPIWRGGFDGGGLY